MLGVGEQLRKSTATAEKLLDRSVNDVRECRNFVKNLSTHAIVAFNFLPENGDAVSHCSPILVTVKRRKCEDSDSLSRVLEPHCVRQRLVSTQFSLISIWSIVNHKIPT